MAAALAVALAPQLISHVRSADRNRIWPAIRPIVPSLAFVTLGAITGDGRMLLAVPALVSLSMLAGFASTLRAGATPMAERFARLVQPELEPAEIAYCRVVTVVWCGFFLVNAGVAGALALGDPAWWALYTGVFAYLLVGALVTVEYVVRKARFRRYGSGLHDRFLRRLFPSRDVTPNSP